MTPVCGKENEKPLHLQSFSDGVIPYSTWVAMRWLSTCQQKIADNDLWKPNELTMELGQITVKSGGDTTHLISHEDRILCFHIGNCVFLQDCPGWWSGIFWPSFFLQQDWLHTTPHAAGKDFLRIKCILHIASHFSVFSAQRQNISSLETMCWLVLEVEPMEMHSKAQLCSR